jgi:arylsulfatase A-like enzyme
VQPWCLFLSYGPPHEPYRPLPPGYEGRYDPAALHLAPNCPDTPEHRQDLADYYTHVTALDDQVGRLLAALETTGDLDRTLIVFTSDHGSMLGSHGRQNKHAPWDEATIVPLLLRFGERLPRGAVDDLLIGHVDLAPTLLGLLDIPPDARMEGQNLAAQVQGARDGRPASVYLQAIICADQAMKDGYLEWRGVRTLAATYAEDLRGPWLLYDDAADPYQLRNLIEDPAAAPLRQTMQHELAGWLARTHDTLEPKEAVLARYSKTALWEERDAHNRRVRNRQTV